MRPGPSEGAGNQRSGIPDSGWTPVPAGLDQQTRFVPISESVVVQERAAQKKSRGDTFFQAQRGNDFIHLAKPVVERKEDGLCWDGLPCRNRRMQLSQRQGAEPGKKKIDIFPKLGDSSPLIKVLDVRGRAIGDDVVTRSHRSW
jgi:hypothetical protein